MGDKVSSGAKHGEERDYDDSVAIRNYYGHDGQNRECNRSDQQIRCRAGQRGEVVVAHDFAEVAGDDGRRLGPAHKEAAEEAESDEGPKDDERGKQQSADGVYVIHGIERDAALEAGGLVAEARGHPGMGTLVEAERKQQQNKLEYSNKQADI